jgi:hypothetical protein
MNGAFPGLTIASQAAAAIVALLGPVKKVTPQEKTICIPWGVLVLFTRLQV